MNNELIYNAVLAGISGSTQNLRQGFTQGADYVNYANRAVILAAAVDARIAPADISQSEALLMSQIVSGIDLHRCFIGGTPAYASIASDIIEMWVEFRTRITTTTAFTLVVELDTIAGLRATPVNFPIVYVRRYAGVGSEGGGGFFENMPGNVTADNGVTWFVNAVGGRYFRTAAKDCVTTMAQWAGAVGDNLTINDVPIARAVTVAKTTTRTVSFQYGIFLVSTPITLPVLATDSGVALIGASPADDYQALPGTWATVIRATAAMPAVITNRSGVDIGYYNSVRNVVIDGNHLAVNGYVNGRQDEMSHSSIVNCTDAGLQLGNETNASKYAALSCTNNFSGMKYDGTSPSGASFHNCKFRDNTTVGILVMSGVQVSWYDCVSESNGTYGLQVIGRANPLAGLDFYNLHCENNGNYQIKVSTTGAVQPASIVLHDPLLVSPNNGLSVLVDAGQLSLRRPMIIVDGAFGANYFMVNAGASFVDIESTDAALVGLTITGTGTGKVSTSFIKVSGAATGRGFGQATKANVLKTQINVAASRTLAPAEVCETIITNYGQPAANCIVELPEATEGYSFTAIIGTAQGANYWRISALGGAAKVSLNGGALQGSATIAAPAVGAAIKFTAFAGAGYYWQATTLAGAWV